LDDWDKEKPGTKAEFCELLKVAGTQTDDTEEEKEEQVEWVCFRIEISTKCAFSRLWVRRKLLPI
jgi:hypothetical protein